MPAAGETCTLELDAAPNDDAVRTTLQTACRHLSNWRYGPETVATAEILLAEILNNIVEHAFADRPAGAITLELRAMPDGVLVQVCDDGAPMPGLRLPEGRPADIDVPEHLLPEGGFGWHLIRSLATDLHYRRADGRNHLRLMLHDRD